MLKFREINYNRDIPAVVQLMREGLDSNYTESIFKWKHIQNPFGESFGLLVEDEGHIVGLRMFMFWQFTFREQKRIKAIRPVDTVIDKKYRGKGLFKKLTMDGIEMCQGKFDLIFNTPNEMSLPVNLRLGWSLLSNSPAIKIGLVNPFSKKYNIDEINFNSFSFLNNYNKTSSIWQTNKTDKFLKWRYSDNRYKAVQFEDSILVFSITKIKNLKMIIVFEMLGNPKKFQSMINSLAEKFKSFLVYFADNRDFEFVKFLVSITRKNSKIVFKNDNIGIHEKINFSLGDLEGKL